MHHALTLARQRGMAILDLPTPEGWKAELTYRMRIEIDMSRQMKAVTGSGVEQLLLS